MFTRKLEMPLFADVELEFILSRLNPKDLQHFMYWYYSFGELIRFSLAYYIYNEKDIEKNLLYYITNASDQEKNEFFNSCINRVILFDDKVIILYNTNKSETKRLTKKKISDITNGKNIDNVKENSFETKRFKRILSGCALYT